MKKPTLQDILDEGVKYYAQLDGCGYRLTILDVLNKGVQHYVQIARGEYMREKDEKKSAEPKKQNIPLGWDGPDSSDGRRYE